MQHGVNTWIDILPINPIETFQYSNDSILRHFVHRDLKGEKLELPLEYLKRSIPVVLIKLKKSI